MYAFQAVAFGNGDGRLPIPAGMMSWTGFDAETIPASSSRSAALFEPGLQDLVKRGLAEGHLRFTDNAAEATRTASRSVAYDTPVDDDRADVEFVFERVTRLFQHLSPGTLVLISSQLPVGTTRRLEQAYAAAQPGKPVTFGYSPENLRLGKAISVFTQPDRVVAGVRTEADRKCVAELLRPFTDRIEWMSVESAEMTKHALNAFLATSVTFINEIATLCEQVGADAKEVERGLKSEARIDPAYLDREPSRAALWQGHCVLSCIGGASSAHTSDCGRAPAMTSTRIGRAADCSPCWRSVGSGWCGG
jgi:UDPglucose 6-dehydrogenase